jgi:hypothetical protein
MSRVTEYVEERKDQVASDAQRQKALKRVTVRMDGDVYAMLTEVAEALKDTPTGCAEELLSAAVIEAWHALENRTQEDVFRVLRHHHQVTPIENQEEQRCH